MQIVYALQEPPASWSASIFLAGPTPRDGSPGWRGEAIEHLRGLGYDGVVFVPETEAGGWHGDYVAQVAWEEQYLNAADCILFWVPRRMADLPGLTTNVEWGRWENSGKVVLGAPEDAENVRYLQHYAEKTSIPTHSTLAATVADAVDMVGTGALRTGGECQVPLIVWRTASFQQWYRAQTHTGNRLDGAQVRWLMRVGPKGFVLFWAMQVNVWVAAEGRHKSNEVVLARPDISTVLAYRRGTTLDESVVVLVREFRSPAATPDGYVRELPGGSSFTGDDALDNASHELSEETGLVIDPSRLRAVAAHQLAATLSAHRAHLYAVEITEDEVAWLREHKDQPHGVKADTERTWAQVMTVGQLRAEGLVDWSTLGMILSVLI